MMKTVEKTKPGTAEKKVMLVGDPLAAFADVGATLEYRFKRSENMLDAINAASNESYSTVYIVMSTFPVGLGSAIRTLRRVSSAKIVLLAKMYEEYKARMLVATPINRAGAADDYLICPVRASELFGGGNEQRQEDERMQAAAIDAAKDARIRELEKLVVQDDLTKLKNRRYVREFLGQILEVARKYKLRATLLVFDIDDFKHYNDAYGHAVGDKVLIQAGDVMTQCCREHDVIARIGGDEFAVVFWDRPSDKKSAGENGDERRQPKAVDHPGDAYVIAERFRKQISTTQHEFLGKEGRGTLTISGGLASFPRDGRTVEQLFEQADMAMLEAKRSGKNRVYLVGQPQTDNGARD